MGSQRSVFNELDVNKIKTVPVDLTKLSNVVKSDVVKKIVYDEFVKIVSHWLDAIDVTNSVKKKSWLQHKN